MKKSKLFIVVLWVFVTFNPALVCRGESSHKRNGENIIINSQPQIPVLCMKQDNEVLYVKMKFQSSSEYCIDGVDVSLNGTTNLSDIESVKLFYIGNSVQSKLLQQYGSVQKPAQQISFKDHLCVNDSCAFFKVMISLSPKVDLLGKINVSCQSAIINSELVYSFNSEMKGLRTGIALRQHNDDQVHTYRIPGLATTNDGTLLAIYDVRRESSRDLQGNIDIGLSRSTDHGNTWEPMRIALDKGEWGNLPQKFNGVSDACILVDQNSKDIFIAGLWMYGVLDDAGQWINNLDETSVTWNHQWRNKGSQAGFDPKQTSQFLIAKSTDDGKNWSEPINITSMCKQKDWWLLAPAPGHGITLKDGTLVFPTQGRDETGESFSNITWSKDHGKTWHTSKMASHGTTENMVVPLSDGSVMLNARDNRNKGNLSDGNGRNIHVSSDLGESWTTHPSSHGALIEPTCMASLHRHFYTENGETKSILIFSNPSSKTNRDHMTIKVSFDEGASWPEKYWLLLDEGKSRGYSCLTSVDEQTIGILYEGSQSDLVFQKIALSDLIGK